MTVQESPVQRTDDQAVACSPASASVTILEPRSGWKLIDFRELWAYRDLFYFLVWRDIKAHYAQTILGVGWAVIQPVFCMLVFTNPSCHLLNP